MSYKFVATSPNLIGELVFVYDQNLQLVEFSTTSQLTAVQQETLATNFPLTHERLVAFVGKTYLTCKLVETDLSFASFMTVYAYPVGRIKDAESWWRRAPDTEKLAAIEAIDGYNFYLMHYPKQQRLYPETWLMEARYKTDYRALLKQLKQQKR